jgi:hypothetical protein
MNHRQPYREFDVSSAFAKVNLNTVGLHDFKMINDEMARVVVTHTGDHTKDTFRTAIAHLFQGVASPLANSFKQLTPNSSIGFITANKEVRTYDNADSIKYRVVASNILMDSEDESLWEMKEGASGKFLARRGHEDLSELATSCISRRVGTPLLASVSVATVAPREFMAFANTQELDMDYGYVVGADTENYKVLSQLNGTVVDVPAECVVHATSLMGSDEEAFGQKVTAGMDKEAMIEYYKKAYSYSQDYIEKIIEVINSHSFA